MVVYAVGIIVATTVNVPSGFTEQWRTSSSSSRTTGMSQELFDSAGAMGNIHGTLNGGANSNITMLIALEPAGAVATPTPTPTPPPGGGISLRAAATGNNDAGGSTLTIGLPAATTSGDVIVAHVIVHTAGNKITPPAGGNQVQLLHTRSSISTPT